MIDVRVNKNDLLDFKISSNSKLRYVKNFPSTQYSVVLKYK